MIGKIEKGITLIALIITIVILIIIMAVTIYSMVEGGFIGLAAKGTQKYSSEMDRELDLMSQIDELLGRKEYESPEETEQPEIPPVNLPKYMKIVEKGTDKKISDYVDDKGLQFVYNGNKITNVNELNADKYNFFYNQTTNTMEGVTSINEIQDLSGKGHTLYLKNGTSVKKDLDGNYYLDFDGEDDYGQINTLEESIDWQNGFEVEFEATWKEFYNWSRILDFGNGRDRDNILIANSETSGKLNFMIFNGSDGEEFEGATIPQNQKVKFKIKYEKTGTDTYRVYLYKDGHQFLSRKTEVKVNNILRTRNYVGKPNPNYTGEDCLCGRIYSLKITQADGTEILRYDLNEQFSQGLELYVIGEGYNDDIIDAAEKNHTLYLKNGANVKRDEDGDYYIEFDGRDDHGVIDELEASIKWSSGFEIEFVAEWNKFGSYSRLCEFANGQNDDNIIVCNSDGDNRLYFEGVYGNSSATGVCETPILVQNERVVYKINYSGSGNREVVITKNGREVLRQRGTRAVKDILRTVNYLGRPVHNSEDYFSGKIYCLKVTQADGTEVMHYDINRLLNRGFKDVKINNIEDWNNFVNKAKAGATYFGRKVTLSSELDLGGAKFTPLPRFEGVFNGNNKKILGLNISGNGEGSGLFNYNSGIIQNLNIENGTLNTGYGKAGLIAGINTGIIDSVNVSGKVSGYDSIGGISGYGTSESIISNCTNSAIISGRNHTRRYTRTSRMGNGNLYKKLR